MTTLLVDGDEYLYKACSALETEVQWDDQNHVLSCNAVEAWDVFSGSLESLKTELGADTMYLAFGGSGNFRRDLYPAYKSKRGRKPLCYARLLEQAFQTYRCHKQDGLEADDVLGIWATGGRFGHTILVSADKDMKTLPVTLYREGQVSTVTEGEAAYNWLFQTLIGDTSDGYPGCPGIGKVKAERLLGEFWRTDGSDTVFVFEPAWEAVVRTYEAAALTKDDAILQARLARILRDSDWDAKKKEVKLWKPK